MEFNRFKILRTKIPYKLFKILSIASSTFGQQKICLKIKTPRHILKLSTKEKRNFLESFDFVFSDLDGVLWNVTDEIEGASDGYKALENIGKKVSFVSNNSIRSMEGYVQKFRGANMPVDLKNIWHPLKSIVKYLKSINFTGLIYVIASENFKSVLRDAGFQIIDGPNDVIEESFAVALGHVFDKQPVRAVIIDCDFNLNIIKMMRALAYLNNPDCLFIAGATDKLFPIRPHVNVLGPGSFTNILKEFCKNELITLGKPGAALAELLKKEYNIEKPKRALMIGDMPEQDVAFGVECGFQTLTVLSGGTKLEDILSETNEQYIPDYYADSMRDFVKCVYDI